ncbi:hypothetical protein JCM11251_000727 [Rhodosporidiobolus azoricus]
MFDRLPVELLEHILRLAAPLDYSPSKRVRDVAQPMLPELFQSGEVVREVEDWESEASEEDLPEDRPEGIKHLVVLSSDPPFEGIDARLVQHTLVSVVVQGTNNDPSIDVAQFTAAPALRRLVLINFTLYSANKMVFPSLAELSLLDCRGNIDFYGALRPSAFPALRACAITVHRDYWSTALERATENKYFPPLESNMYEQLDILVADAGDVHPSELPLHGSGDLPTLVEVSARALINFEKEGAAAAPLPAAMRLQCNRDVAASVTKRVSRQFVDQIASFAAYLGALPHGLRVLVLPSHIRPQEGCHRHVVQAVHQLLHACETGRVEVIWEEEPDPNYDSLVSHGFWAWAKRHKAERRGGNGELPL